MKKRPILILIFILIALSFIVDAIFVLTEPKQKHDAPDEPLIVKNINFYKPQHSTILPIGLVPEGEQSTQSLKDIQALLSAKANHLNPAVINKVLTTLTCANAQHLEYNNILTIIDYALPSNEKRLWVFDLSAKKLLFHTYVSHGIRSGTLLSRYFSNQNNSKASSIGIFQTDKPYYGRHGPSLKLTGLDQGFNDNASSRDVVMHGGWYVEENFIKKYGRAGRSWGCPAVPDELITGIINKIKDRSLLVVYYPYEQWLSKSKFLNCDQLYSSHYLAKLKAQMTSLYPEYEAREDVFFANRHEKNQEVPILVMPAPRYEQIFHSPVPLGRMLRRQINQTEYIALSEPELNHIAQDPSALNDLSFVTPVIHMVRGYYATEMQPVFFGKIKEVRSNGSPTTPYTVILESNSTLSLTRNNQFIRWLGL